MTEEETLCTWRWRIGPGEGLLVSCALLAGHEDAMPHMSERAAKIWPTDTGWGVRDYLSVEDAEALR